MIAVLDIDMGALLTFTHICKLVLIFGINFVVVVW